MKKNLVMGTASGFDWDTLEPFLTSFVMNVKSAELVLFLKDISDFTLDRLKRCGKDVLKIEPFEYKENKTLGIDRFKNFKRYIDSHGDDYEQIFITDTRDVIFQKDIFESFKGYKNYLGYSTEADDIRGSKTGSKINYDWIVNIFGKEEADKLLDKKIICAGSALIGTPREVKIFLEILFSKNLPSENEKFAFDQAAFNYLFHNNLIPIENLIEMDVDSGEVFTMALYVNIYPIEIRNEKIFRNGGVPAVVHQYDRKEEMLQLVDEIYHAKDFQFDGRFVNTRSTIEQTTSLLRADKIGEATRLFLKKFLSDTDFSKFGGALIRLWDTTLKKSPSQTLELLEIAVQSSAKSCKYFSGYVWQSICEMIKRAEKKGRSVDEDFKIYVANTVWEMAEQCLKENQPEICFDIIQTIEELNMPPNKNFYLFVAKANRIFGRKAEALAAYKRALELS